MHHHFVLCSILYALMARCIRFTFVSTCAHTSYAISKHDGRQQHDRGPRRYVIPSTLLITCSRRTQTLLVWLSDCALMPPDQILWTVVSGKLNLI
ncbi:hypothetical protein B0J17DRAFT_455966 [Rhizoctonia solani]|nr:hypothetical protein B0J17DRAFT_455966 [Rhizoctonia solani]